MNSMRMERPKQRRDYVLNGVIVRETKQDTKKAGGQKEFLVVLCDQRFNRRKHVRHLFRMRLRRGYSLVRKKMLAKQA